MGLPDASTNWMNNRIGREREKSYPAKALRRKVKIKENEIGKIVVDVGFYF